MNYIGRTNKKQLDNFINNLEKLNKSSLYFEYKISKEEAWNLIDEIKDLLKEMEELKRKNYSMSEKINELYEKIEKKFDNLEIKVKIDGQEF